MILCSGCFDGIHAGHILYLEAARRAGYGGKMRVAIAPDSYIRDVKGREPYWPQLQRARAIEALLCVESAICHPENSVANVIHAYRPSMFVKGVDWRNKLPDDVVQACRAVECQVVFVDTEGTHVTEAHA